MIKKIELPHPFIIFVLIYIIILIIYDLTGNFSKNNLLLNINLNRYSIIEGRILNNPLIKNDEINFLFKVQNVDGKPVKIRVLAKKYHISHHLKCDDILKLKGKLYLPVDIKNPGSFDYRTYLLRNRINGLLYIENILESKHSNRPSLRGLINSINKNIENVISKNLPQEESSILLMMFAGIKGYLPDDLRDAFTDAGAMHVLVVSGLNIGYVAALFLFLFKFLPIPNKFRILLLILPVTLYCLITGANPPVTRATIMTVSFIISFFLARESAIYHSFALSALVILLLNPQDIFTASMQMSFSACLGIVYIYPKISIKKMDLKFLDNKKNINENVFSRGIVRYIINLFLLTFSAQLSVTPIIAYYFYKVSIITFISNVLIVPLAGIILFLSFGLIIVSFILPFFIPVLAFLSKISADILIQLVMFFSSFPFSIIHTGKPSILFIIIYYIILILFFKLKYFKYKFYVLICCFSVFAGSYIYKFFLSKTTRISILDVGTGNCIVFKLPQNKNYIIDCGGDNISTGEYIIKPFLMSNGIKNIDCLLITTPKWTHFSGLETILKNFNVKKIILHENYIFSVELRRIIEKINKRKIDIIFISENDKIKNIFPIKRNKNIYFEIFQDSSTLSSPVLLTKFCHDKFSMLCTSDAKIYLINNIIKKIGKLNILELPSHGKIEEKIENASDFDAFLVSGRKSIDYFINNYPEILNKLYLTSKHGAIEITVRKKEYIISSFIKNSKN